MTRIVSQGPCPNPYHIGGEQSQAYTIYDDGSTHCFTCGYHLKANDYRSITNRLMNIQQKSIVDCPQLPKDCVKALEAPYQNKALKWLKSYGITDAEIESNGFLWSQEKEYLVFPVYSEEKQLLMWQARYFGNVERHPKYITRGKKEEVLHILGWGKGENIILVEDLISAIKISRQSCVMPLWGSFLSAQQAKRISQLFQKVYLWLDYDKRDYSIKTAFNRCMYLTIYPIITDSDPKVYTDNKISSILQERKKE